MERRDGTPGHEAGIPTRPCKKVNGIGVGVTRGGPSFWVARWDQSIYKPGMEGALASVRCAFERRGPSGPRSRYSEQGLGVPGLELPGPSKRQCGSPVSLALLAILL